MGLLASEKPLKELIVGVLKSLKARCDLPGAHARATRPPIDDATVLGRSRTVSTNGEGHALRHVVAERAGGTS